ncbi:MAG: phosphotransferase [Fusicatenibacter sp.]|nr:phosphotransferase [Fusicatenibacter sp.]
MKEFHFITRDLIRKGWPEDKKYCVTDADGTRYLLRVSDLSAYKKKQMEFQMMQRVEKLGIPMCRPIAFGTCGEGVYSIQSWIDGEDADEVISSFLKKSSILTDWKLVRY